VVRRGELVAAPDRRADVVEPLDQFALVPRQRLDFLDVVRLAAE
jgi:hypothetical protein